MPAAKENLLKVLTIIILVLASFASVMGILYDGLYTDEPLIRSAWKTNDLVTLVVVVPFSAAAILFASLGSGRAGLIWGGLLAYMFYNYSFYLFGAGFNAIFLVYAALFGLSLYALIIFLLRLDTHRVSRHFSSKTPRKLVAGYLALTSLPLIYVEGSQCIQFILNGTRPTVPALVLALDLSMVVPSTLVAAVLLWIKNPWGYVLSTIMLVKGLTYGIVLTVGSYVIVTEKLGDWDELIPFYLVLVMGGAFGLIVLLRNFKESPQERENLAL